MPRTLLAAAIDASALTVRLGERVLLDSLDLRVAHASSVAITGPSGSGKSTLLSCLAALRTPDAGTLHVAGTDITALRKQQRAAWRLANIGFIYQFGELLPELTPVENVTLPALLAGQNQSAAERDAEELLGELQVSAVTGSATGVLSGGERQRVAIARALITRPALLLADEPTGSLDRTTGSAVADLLFALPQQRNCALVLVTHNQQIAERADTRYELELGRLRAC